MGAIIHKSRKDVAVGNLPRSGKPIKIDDSSRRSENNLKQNLQLCRPRLTQLRSMFLIQQQERGSAKMVSQKNIKACFTFVKKYISLMFLKNLIKYILWTDEIKVGNFATCHRTNLMQTLCWCCDGTSQIGQLDVIYRIMNSIKLMLFDHQHHGEG